MNQKERAEIAERLQKQCVVCDDLTRDLMLTGGMVEHERARKIRLIRDELRLIKDKFAVPTVKVAR